MSYGPPKTGSSSAGVKSAWLQGTSSSTKPSTSSAAPKSAWNTPKTATASTSQSSTKSAWNPSSSSPANNSTYASKYSAPSSSSSTSLSPWSASVANKSAGALVPASKPTSSAMWSSSPTAASSSTSQNKYALKPASTSITFGQSSSSTSSSASSAWSSTKSSSSQQQHQTTSTKGKSGGLSTISSSTSTSTAKAYSSKEQQHSQIVASSINKNVIDKAANLSLYKSPDLLAMRSGNRQLAGTLAGSKYYTPVYSRTGDPLTTVGAGGLMRVGTAGALATAVLHHSNVNSVPINEMMANRSPLTPANLLPSTPLTSGGIAATTPLTTRPGNVSVAKSALNRVPVTNPTKTEQLLPTMNKPPTSRTKAKSGYLLIFNHQEFRTPGVPRRAGSKKDEEALCRTFYEFGFNPIVKSNLKLKEVDKVAKDLRNKDFKKYDCCVVVILSHGHQNETISAADGQYKLQTMLVDRVAMNETLQGKAKIFIVAACKGDAEVQLHRTPAEQAARLLQTDAQPFVTEPKLLPYMRDTLKCFSTYEGFVSYRDPERGTVFVQELCRQLSEHGKTMHLEDILKHVNVTLTERPIFQQVPSVTSTMSFNIYFGDLKH